MEALSLPFFQTAVLAALVLAGIHAYLGFHIVRRGVLFVDLALAQMAALGVALGIVLGREHDEVGSYLMALGMTFIGAALFAWLRGRARQVPLEAFIGIVFATAQALVFLLRKEGFEVATATDGVAGLAEFDRTGGDIVLLRPGQYNEPGTYTRAMTFRATRGSATIGTP